MVPVNSSSACSNTSRESMSRWLVGSSRIRRLSLRSISFDSATRPFSPPDSVEIGWNTSSPVKRNSASAPRTWSGCMWGKSSQISSMAVFSGCSCDCCWS